MGKCYKQLTYNTFDGKDYIIISDKKILSELEKRTVKKGYPLYPEKLIWTPYKNKYDF